MVYDVFMITFQYKESEGKQKYELEWSTKKQKEDL